MNEWSIQFNFWVTILLLLSNFIVLITPKSNTDKKFNIPRWEWRGIWFWLKQNLEKLTEIGRGDDFEWTLVDDIIVRHMRSDRVLWILAILIDEWLMVEDLKKMKECLLLEPEVKKIWAQLVSVSEPMNRPEFKPEKVGEPSVCNLPRKTVKFKPNR